MMKLDHGCIIAVEPTVRVQTRGIDRDELEPCSSFELTLQRHPRNFFLTSKSSYLFPLATEHGHPSPQNLNALRLQAVLPQTRALSAADLRQLGETRHL